MTTVSDSTLAFSELELEPWRKLSSSLKKSAAMEAAVCVGVGVRCSDISGGEVEVVRNGDRGMVGMKTELARRGGTMPPFEDCREFSDAFRSSVGVAEREWGPLLLAEDGPFKGLRRALPGRGLLGDRLTAGLNGRGDLAGDGEDVVRDSCFKDCAKSLSLLTVGYFFRGEGDGEADEDAIVVL